MYPQLRVPTEMSACVVHTDIIWNFSTCSNRKFHWWKHTWGVHLAQCKNPKKHFDNLHVDVASPEVHVSKVFSWHIATVLSKIFTFGSITRQHLECAGLSFVFHVSLPFTYSSYSCLLQHIFEHHLPSYSAFWGSENINKRFRAHFAALRPWKSLARLSSPAISSFCRVFY